MTDLEAEHAQLARARVLMDMGRDEAAIGLLRPVVGSTPDHAEAWSLLALAHLQLDQDDQALAAARSGLAVSPDDEWLHRLASLALRGLGRPRDAVDEAREAVRLAPMLWQSHVVLASALRELAPKDPGARQAALRAVELGPLAPETHLALGAVAAASGDPVEARSAFERALELNPQSAPARNELARLDLRGSAFFGAKGLAGAVEGFADVARVAPRDQVGRANVDAVLHSVLTRSAYLVFVAVWVGNRVTDASDAGWARLLPVVLVLAPVAFSVRFVLSLTPRLRDYLWVALRPRHLFASAVLGGLAILCVLAAAVAPPGPRSGLGGLAAVLGLASRLLVAAAPRPGAHLVRTPMIRVLLAISVLFMVVCLAGLGDPEIRAALLWAVAVSLVVSAWLVTILRRRRGENACAST